MTKTLKTKTELLNKSVFTLSDMLDCWETAQDSFSKEIGGDMEEVENEEDGYIIPINKEAYFKESYFIDIKK